MSSLDWFQRAEGKEAPRIELKTTFVPVSTVARRSALYPVYTIKLARRAGYMLAGRASSMFARSCKRGISLYTFTLVVKASTLSVDSALVYACRRQVRKNLTVNFCPIHKAHDLRFLGHC